MFLKKLIKWLSRTFGNFLLTLGITLFILSFFASSALNNLDSLKNTLVNELTTDDVLSEISGIDIKQARELCKTNPALEECKRLNDIKNEFANNTEVNNLLNKAGGYSKYLLPLRILSFVLFILGFLFIFLGSEFSLFLAGKKVALSAAITSLFAVIYYKLLPNLFESVFNSAQIQEKLKEFSSVIVEKVKNIVINWITLQLNSAFKIALILTVVFALIFIALKIYEKKKGKEKISN